MASTWALHVIAVEATRCARREVHVQVERKMTAAILHALGMPTVARPHGRRYAP